MKRSRYKRTPLVERLEERVVLTLPFGAAAADTAEYLLGDVLVNVVLMESQGAASSEDWNASLIQATKDKVKQATDWWVETLYNYEMQLGIPFGTNPLNFQFNYEFADAPVDTSHEPIAEVSQGFQDWIQDFFAAAGVSSTGTFHDQIREFNNDKRVEFGSDWSFTIFVVNDEQDADNKFAFEDDQGNQTYFTQAFAYAGGEFYISPAGRPVKTFAHEMGHIFWAKDEYAGGASYNDVRGYYGTENHNALYQSPPGFVQQPSIMTSDLMPDMLMQEAFANHTSSVYTLEMVGWRDADGDGLFDVLQPHTLSGNGYFDADLGVYRFIGSSQVTALPNQNPSGLGNDITINVIRNVQYRFDGGDWQTMDIVDGHSVNLDLSIPTPQDGFTSIELRTFDSKTNAASAVFQGAPGAPTSTESVGISGFVRYDENNNGQADDGEIGLAGWTVELVGGPAGLFGLVVEPDNFDQGDPIFLSENGHVAFLSAVGANGVTGLAAGSLVRSGSGSPASTGGQVFRFSVGETQLSEAWNEFAKLRVEFFDETTSYIQIDAIGNGGGDYARLEGYNAAGQLIAQTSTGLLEAGQVETLTIGRGEGDIHHILAYGFNGTGVQFDNLHVGPPTSVVTNAQGAFAFPFLTEGLYALQLTPPAGGVVTGQAIQDIAYVAGTSVANVTFTGIVSAAQNPNNPYDVDADGAVNLTDILALLVDLRTHGSHAASEPGGAVSPPYYDVNGDGQVDLVDILSVLVYLRQHSGGAGEGAFDEIDFSALFHEFFAGGASDSGTGVSDNVAVSPNTTPSISPSNTASNVGQLSGVASPAAAASGLSSISNSQAAAPTAPPTPFTLDTSLRVDSTSKRDFLDRRLETIVFTAAGIVAADANQNDVGLRKPQVALAPMLDGGQSASSSLVTIHLFAPLVRPLQELDISAVDHLFHDGANDSDARRPAQDQVHRPANVADQAEKKAASDDEHKTPSRVEETADASQALDEVFRELERTREFEQDSDASSSDESKSTPAAVIDDQTLDLLSAGDLQE